MLFLQFKHTIFAVLRMHKKENSNMCISYFIFNVFYVARRILFQFLILQCETFKKSFNIIWKIRLHVCKNVTNENPYPLGFQSTIYRSRCYHTFDFLRNCYKKVLATQWNHFEKQKIDALHKTAFCFHLSSYDWLFWKDFFAKIL